jgi:hypothetical protein
VWWSCSWKADGEDTRVTFDIDTTPEHHIETVALGALHRFIYGKGWGVLT